MSGVFPLSVVLRPGSADCADALVQAADAAVSDTSRVQIRSHRKGLELECVYVSDADAVISALNTIMTSDVRVVDRSVRFLTEPELMEPVMRVEIVTLLMLLPVVMALLDELRAQDLASVERDEHIVVVAQVPLQEILDLPSRLLSLGDGDARLQSVSFSHHARI